MQTVLNMPLWQEYHSSKIFVLIKIALAAVSYVLYMVRKVSGIHHFSHNFSTR